jgi:DNA-binding NarL/FixJ family response regulator
MREPKKRRGYRVKLAVPGVAAAAVIAMMSAPAHATPPQSHGFNDPLNPTTVNGPHPSAGFRGLDHLTRRELEVLDQLLDGWRVASIARSLYVSEHTIRNHLKAIYRKLGAHSQQELIERLKSPGTA